MTIVSAGKVFDTCQRCGKLVQLNKAMLGGLHFCVSDCVVEGRHLDLSDEVRGHLWWKQAWRMCGACGREWNITAPTSEGAATTNTR